MNELYFKKKLINLDDSFTKFVIANSINEPYTYFLPINKLKEEKNFFNALSQKKEYEPRLKYKKINVKELLKELEEYKKKFSDLIYPLEIKYLKNIYLNKIDELIIFTKMIGSINKKNFTKLSRQAYGVPNVFLVNFAYVVVFLSKTINLLKKFRKKRYLSKEEILKKFELFCKKHDFIDWELEFNKELLSIAFILPSEKKVILNDSLKYGSLEIQRLFKHELGVHGKRHIQGKKILGIFSFGLAKYDELEEGLATFEEVGLYGFFDVLTMPALKSIAVDTALKKNFYETFQKIYKITRDVEISFSLVMRVKRGVLNNEGAYTKDYLYFSGFFKVLLYYLKGFFFMSRIKKLFIGKISFNEVNKLQEVNKIKEFFKK